MKYEICIVSKEYRWIEVEASDESEASDAAWGQIESVLNRKPEDYDTELFIERKTEPQANLNEEAQV